MASIWIIEDPELQKNKIFECISMNFAVRRIASISSFARILEMESIDRRPDLVVINDVLSCNISTVIGGIHLIHQNVEAFLTVVADSSSAQWLDVAVERKVPIVSLNRADALNVKSVLNELIERSRGNRRATINSASNTFIEFGDIKLEPFTGELEIGGDVFEDLSPKELRILELLMASPNQCVLRTSLAEYVWPRMKISDRTMDSHMSRLRKKIAKSICCTLESIYGKGYSLKST